MLDQDRGLLSLMQTVQLTDQNGETLNKLGNLDEMAMSIDQVSQGFGQLNNRVSLNE